MSLNLSSSPFTAVSYQNYTFLSCPRNQATSFTGLTTAIDCLSNLTTRILATRYQSEVMRLYMCKKIITLPVPVSYLYEHGLPLKLELTWNVSSFNNPVGASNHQSVFRITTVSFLSVALIVPALIICLVCCISMMRRENHRGGDTISTSAEVALSMNVAAGLDESMIESYEKVTIGESRRIPGPNGITCTICLADYGPKEIVKLMPECEHCFHVECIDKWLRTSSNSPICRNSPVTLTNS
ncbi:RING-H2 finger protein ATL22-like [Olea europaea var. sylvestris]|uniref:RING-H2 finger protein ATL22-like n=1 Tax=Olea europaea var. sylvestris TaxID=158386 RepID=UPI000C1CFDAA|nr:RING-H2 finger protein ATL22-like [Olea europaea var. sylvestris]